MSSSCDPSAPRRHVPSQPVPPTKTLRRSGEVPSSPPLAPYSTRFTSAPCPTHIYFNSSSCPVFWSCDLLALVYVRGSLAHHTTLALLIDLYSCPLPPFPSRFLIPIACHVHPKTQPIPRCLWRGVDSGGGRRWRWRRSRRGTGHSTRGGWVRGAWGGRSSGVIAVFPSSGRGEVRVCGG